MTSTESIVPATAETPGPERDGPQTAPDLTPQPAPPAGTGPDTGHDTGPETGSGTGAEPRLAAVELGLAAVADRLADDAARAAARERVIDRQHAEIERLRSVERAGQLRPVITDLYRLRNDLLRQATSAPATMTAEQAAALLRSYADEVADALERCGVTVAACAAGDPFEPGRHQVAAVVPTADPARDGTVAEVVQDGYAETDGGRVVAPARVALFRLAEENDDV